MLTPFGGAIRHEVSSDREELPASFAAVLAAAHTHPHPPVDGLTEECASLATYDVDEHAVTYTIDLSTVSPWTPHAETLPEALALLARVARTLAALHTRGVLHGDLRPELIAVDADHRAVLLAPARASLPGAVLRARLHPGGVAPHTVAWAAPEVIAGTDATPASDVYSLAAITYATLTGSAPLGQVDLRYHATGPRGDLARALAASLDTSPANRPSMEALAFVLERAATLAASEQNTAGTPYRGAPASRDPSPAPARELSPVLLLALLGGGLVTFVGAVMLVSLGWEVTGAFGRVALLSSLSVASWGLGAVAKRFGVAAGVVVARVLAGIFATVTLAFAFSQLDDPGRLALLVGLTAGALLGGVRVERRGAPTGGAVLVGLGTQLPWAVGAQVIYMVDDLHGAGPVTALAAMVSSLTYVAALGRRSTSLSVLAALDVVVFAIALGVYLRTDSVLGPPGYALAVAAGYTLLAAGAARRGPEALAWPFAFAAGTAALTSAAIGVEIMDDHTGLYRTVGALWPYGVAAGAVALARSTTPVGRVHRFVATTLVVLVPTVEALLRGTLFTALVAVASGALVLTAALMLPALRHASDARTEWILAGLFGMLCAPDLHLMRTILRTPFGEESDALRWWVLVVLVALGLIATARASTGHIGRGNHQLVEGAGALSLLGALSLQVLTTPRATVPALAALTIAGMLGAYGLVSRRTVPFLSGVAAFVVHAWVQYFVRLKGVLPTSILVLGFGVGLLAAGVLYEQRLRPNVAALRDWN